MGNRPALRILNLAHFIDHYFMLIFPTAVLALHKEWGMSYSDALSLGAPAFILYAAATLPCGWLGDMFRGATMMRVFFFGIGVSAILVGLAPDPLALMFAMAALGLFAAIYHPVATAMIVNLAERPGRELGINGVYGNLGVALAAAVTGLLAAWISWRAAFIVPGIVAVTLGIYYLFHSRPGGGATGRDIERPDPSPSASAQLNVFLIVGVTALFGGFVFAGVTVALPKLFEERLSAEMLGIAGIGIITTAVFFTASFTQLFTGRLIDRIGPRPVLIIATGLQAPLLLAVAFLPGTLAVPLAVPLMLVIFGAIPVSSWLLGRYVGKAWRSRAYSMQFVLALGVNAAIIPVISGLYEQTGSTSTLFVILAACSLLICMVSLRLPDNAALLRDTTSLRAAGSTAA